MSNFESPNLHVLYAYSRLRVRKSALTKARSPLCFALEIQSALGQAHEKSPSGWMGFREIFNRSTAAFFAGALFHHPHQDLAVRHGDVELHVTFADVRAGALV